MPASPSAPTASKWKPIEISLMVGAVLLITLCAFEGLATTTIMPNVVADLDADAWFSVASGSSLAAQLTATVIAGILTDWKGPRTVLLSGLALFTIGLLVSAWAWAILPFVFGRIVQGLGAGLLIVPLYVLIGSVAAPARRPTYFAAFSLAWALPSLIGPAIAGFVAKSFGWRPVFWAVPILAIIAVIPLLSVLAKFAGRPRTAPSSLASLSAMAIVGGLGVVFFQLSGAVSGLKLVILFVLGITATTWALPRLLPRGAFVLKRGVPTAIVTRMLAMGVQASAGAFIPLVLQRVHGWQADAASLSVTLGSLSWSVGAVAQARIKNPQWRIRLPLIGTILMLVGVTIMLALLFKNIPVWISILGWMISGMGVGLMHASLSVLTLGMTPQSQHGKVSSWLQVADSAGSAVELAVVSILMALWASMGISGSLGYLPAMVTAIAVAIIAVIAARRIDTASSEVTNL